MRLTRVLAGMTPTATRIRTTAAAIALLAAAALAGPPAASAATGTAFNAGTNTLTFTGDAAGDELVIGEANGAITQSLNGGAATPVQDNGTNLPADDTINVVVNAGGGNDTVTVTTPRLASLTVDGGDGNDTVTGNDDDD